MTDITVSRELLRQILLCCEPGVNEQAIVAYDVLNAALDAPIDDRIKKCVDACVSIPTYQLTVENGEPNDLGAVIDQLRQPAPTQDSRNHVGNSRFESWFSEYDPSGKGEKQRARDAYAAGMGDPVYLPAPTQGLVRWAKSRDVGRYGDMSQHAHMRVGLDSDNDVYVSVWDDEGGAPVEFCTPGAGGGKSSKTRMALIALMVAMEEDSTKTPHLDWWARRFGTAPEEKS